MSISAKAIGYAFCPAMLRPFWDRIEASEVGYRVAKGAFWSLVGTVMSSGLGLLASILVARMLGKAVYGELGMVRSTVGMFGALAGLGLGLTATKHIAEFRHVDRVRAGRIMALSGQVAFATGALAATACFVLAPWLAANVLAAPQLAGLIRIGCLVLFLEAITGAQTGALAGFEAFRSIAQLNLAVGLIAFPCLVVGAYLGGSAGVVWGMVANTSVKWGLSHLALRRQAAQASIPFRFTDGWCEIGVLWQFSIPATLAGTIVGPVMWTCNAMLVNQPEGYLEIGVYEAANQWFSAALVLPGLICGSLLPILSEQLGRGNALQSRRLMRLSIAISGLLAMPAILLAVLASPWIMAAYGAEFAGGRPTLVLALLTAGIVAVQGPIAQVINASGRLWIGMVMNLGWGVSFITMAWLLVSWGSPGLAGARLIAYLFHTVWTFGFAVNALRPKI